MDSLRIGLIGAGMIGQFRAQALAKMEEAQLVAVADTRQDLATQIASKDKRIRLFSDGLALAGDSAVDAVIISTPPAFHEPLALACLSAGKHVLCEKPLATSVESCERLVKAAAENALCLATGFTLRQTPAAKLARTFVDRGEIGKIDHVRAFHGHPGGRHFGPDWILNSEMTGGGTLMDNGIHMIDFVRWFLGDVTDACGFASDHTWQKKACEDNGFLLVRNAKGQIGSIHSSWTEWRGYGYRLEIYGTKGFVRFGYPPLWLVHGQGEPGSGVKIKHSFFPIFQILERLRGWQWAFVETLLLDIKDWVAGIRKKTQAPASGRDGMEAVRLARCVKRFGGRAPI